MISVRKSGGVSVERDFFSHEMVRNVEIMRKNPDSQCIFRMNCLKFDESCEKRGAVQEKETFFRIDRPKSVISVRKHRAIDR